MTGRVRVNPRAAIVEEADRLAGTLPAGVEDRLVADLHARADAIAAAVVSEPGAPAALRGQQRLDRILTHRIGGFFVMGLLFYAVFWFTITGAAVPSDLLFDLLVGRIHPELQQLFAAAGSPVWVTGLLVDGVYLSTAWVVAVMLPPMAIFFPLFALLEDFGYLPRVAFNLDRLFARSGAHGKQALTMMMGFGCNAAGITATRIIESPRERMIAILTNNFSICNGRWPTLMLMGTIFVGAVVPAPVAGAVAAGAVVLVAVIGVGTALASSWLLSRTLLRGQASVFTLELPPYRRPTFWRTIASTAVDRTFVVLRRAVIMAAPAGAVLWVLSNVTLGQVSLAAHAVSALDPLGLALGLNGIILIAYIVAIPANEIVIPTILMLTITTGTAAATATAGATPGVMLNLGDAQAEQVLVGIGGWTLLTAVNLMLFSLLHNPCSTTMLTIWKETGSVRWTAVSAALPLAVGFAVTFATATVARAL